MSINPTDFVNIITAVQMLDSLYARAGEITAGMKDAVSEGRDLTDEELEGFWNREDDEDKRLEKSLEARRQRELIGKESNKITGETGGDIRP